MNVLVTGDTHNDFHRLQKEILAERDIQLMLHTGDHFRDASFLASSWKISCHAVTGNCDGGETAPSEKIVTVESHRILLCHGHLYGVKRSLNRLFYRAQEAEAEMVVFGHTHIGLLEQIGGIWFMNPGSPTYPRGGAVPSYGLIRFEEGKIFPRLVELTG